MTSKTALITGITGQDGAYLAALLLEKGYAVHGLKRRSSLFNTQRIDALYRRRRGLEPSFHLHDCDMTDTGSLLRLMDLVQPDEVYNLAAQSHVPTSFETPEYTSNVNALGTLRLLETIRQLDLIEKTRFYQASTSELFGLVQETPQRETTPFYPRSPYAVAKLYAYWITVNYRESYNIFACNGILFNHESPLRGETFVTRKITRAAARIKHGLQEKLSLGNLDSQRDWGFAGDFVEGMRLMLQQEKPDDYVLATGVPTTVRRFAELAFQHVGMEIEWSGKAIEEKGRCRKTGKTLVNVDPKFFRPAEVEFLLGDSSKAREKLGWSPQCSLEELVEKMAQHDLQNAEQEILLRKNGFAPPLLHFVS
ncbi:MAG: GDP-mannose 4,6-dehydratase [Planctomycetaceae bacterium]|jgi:GDPmannose 4,6-dehydratase|nr:GDP-mannose 4,6-dehydratase [Planctomycetaceae bacterium]